jgi:hypothetical protein
MMVSTCLRLWPVIATIWGTVRIGKQTLAKADHRVGAVRVAEEIDLALVGPIGFAGLHAGVDP